MSAPFAVHVRWVDNDAFVGYRHVGSIASKGACWVATQIGNHGLMRTSIHAGKGAAKISVEVWAVSYLGGTYGHEE